MAGTHSKEGGDLWRMWEITIHNSSRFLINFFFQAGDGIRGYKVTGVQTCALPIWSRAACCATPTAPPRGRELPPAGARDQRLDPRANLIANLPHALDGLVLGVGERPVLVGHPGHDRARRAAAHGDEHVDGRDQVAGQATRPRIAELDAELAHDLRDRRAYPLGGVGAGRESA